MAETNVKSAETTQSKYNITVSKDSMSATLIVRQHGSGDTPLTSDHIHQELTQLGIVFGINTAEIDRVISEKITNTPVKIVQGEAPKRGKDAEFIYHFDTTRQHRPQVDDDGRIDYKNINFIQNVEKGQLLATRTPPEEGQLGTNIKGENIKGAPGRDLPFKAGVNTEISPDGLQLHASASGAIVFINGVVSVNDVMVIRSDVDFNVGNIDCRGSVRVYGTIKTGFQVKCDGDLEVAGNVEDCTLDIGGNIMVKGGFFGKGSGLMKAGGSVFAKYVEGQRIEAGGDVQIGGEVINCEITCGGNVQVKGKHGKIVGGEIKANKEIRASILGADAGTITVLSVAYDIALMKKYYDTVKEIKRLDEDAERIKQVLYGLYRQQMDGKLSAEQKQALEKLEEFRRDLPQNLEHLGKEKKRIEAELSKLLDARIIAETRLYPGVRAAFGLVYRDILEETGPCVIQSEGTKVYLSEYQP